MFHGVSLSHTIVIIRDIKEKAMDIVTEALNWEVWKPEYIIPAVIAGAFTIFGVIMKWPKHIWAALKRWWRPERIVLVPIPDNDEMHEFCRSVVVIRQEVIKFHPNWKDVGPRGYGFMRGPDNLNQLDETMHNLLDDTQLAWDDSKLDEQRRILGRKYWAWCNIIYDIQSYDYENDILAAEFKNLHIRESKASNEVAIQTRILNDVLKPYLLERAEKSKASNQ